MIFSQKGMSDITTDNQTERGVEVIDEVNGSSYTTIDSSQSEGSTVNNESNSTESKQDFRKEGKEKADYLELANIKFAENQLTLPPNPKFSMYLDSIATLLNEDKYYVELIGHTSKTVNLNVDNYKIGLKRAEHIKTLLIEKGVEASKIVVDSKGADEPREEGESAETLNKNRRVELFLKTN
jgi:outer membrane protein OmpA-like peptidoglycan-associated protein